MKYIHEYDAFSNHRIVLIQIVGERTHRIEGEWFSYMRAATLGENLVCFSQYYGGMFQPDFIYQLSPVEEAEVVKTK